MKLIKFIQEGKLIAINPEAVFSIECESDGICYVASSNGRLQQIKLPFDTVCDKVEGFFRSGITLDKPSNTSCKEGEICSE